MLKNTNLKDLKNLGGNSQNFLGKFVRFFVTMGFKFLRLFRLKVLYVAFVITKMCHETDCNENEFFLNEIKLNYSY